MTIEPRLHTLAVQAWARIRDLHHDPIESIVAALRTATGETRPLPEHFDTLTPARRRVALVLADGQAHHLHDIRAATRTSKSQTWHLLSLMVRDQLVERLGVGVYRLARHAPRRRAYRGAAGAYCTTRDLIAWLSRRDGATPAEVAAWQRVPYETARSRLGRLRRLGELVRTADHRYLPTPTVRAAATAAPAA